MEHPFLTPIAFVISAAMLALPVLLWAAFRMQTRALEALQKRETAQIAAFIATIRAVSVGRRL
jgi:archaellin